MTKKYLEKNEVIKVLPYYLIGIGLIIFYLFVLYKGIAIDSCREYKLYYVDKLLEDWPGYGGLEYELGTPVDFDLGSGSPVRQRGKGWGTLETEGCWIEDEAILYFSGLPTDRDLMLTISLQKITNNTVIRINANEKEISRFYGNEAAEQKELSVVIPPYIVDTGGELQLDFCVDRTNTETEKIMDDAGMMISQIVIN